MRPKTIIPLAHNVQMVGGVCTRVVYVTINTGRNEVGRPMHLAHGIDFTGKTVEWYVPDEDARKWGWV